MMATPYRFGDLLALARRSWTLSMAEELARRGFSDYRVTDAASMRLLLTGPLSIGRLARAIGVSRQAASKIVRGLTARDLAETRPSPLDARATQITLTETGWAYAKAVVEVIDKLNHSLASQVGEADLAAADRVLRLVVAGGVLEPAASRLPTPGLGRSPSRMG